MTPRHPQGEYSSLKELKELKKFFREYGPDIEHGPCDLNQEPRLPQTSSDKYNRATNVDVKKDSAISNIPVLRHATGNLDHSHEHSIVRPAADYEPATLEILQPAVYKPSKCVANVMPSGRENGAKPLHQAESRIDQQARLISDLSSEEQILRQRALALQALERRLTIIKSTWDDDKPLPAVPIESDGARSSSLRTSESPSPVPTEKIIEKIMERTEDAWLRAA
jgi:hypothetical protein